MYGRPVMAPRATHRDRAETPRCRGDACMGVRLWRPEPHIVIAQRHRGAERDMHMYLRCPISLLPPDDYGRGVACIATS
jgi:hypothetical protein